MMGRCEKVKRRQGGIQIFLSMAILIILLVQPALHEYEDFMGIQPLRIARDLERLHPADIGPNHQGNFYGPKPSTPSGVHPLTQNFSEHVASALSLLLFPNQQTLALRC
jgi:hypothetical protein